MVLVCQAGWILSVKLRSGATHASAQPYLCAAGGHSCLIGPPQERHLSWRSPNRHIPFVSAWRSLFTFQWLDIPIRAAPIYSFPLCRVQSLIFFSFLFFPSRSLPLRPPNTPLCGLFGFASLKGPQCSLSYSFLSVSLSVCLWWLDTWHYDFRNIVSCQTLMIFKQTNSETCTVHCLSLFSYAVPR